MITSTINDSATQPNCTVWTNTPFYWRI